MLQTGSEAERGRLSGAVSKGDELRLAYGTLETPGDSRNQDAEALVAGCLDRLVGLQGLPPKLFVLWVSPAFKCDAGMPRQVSSEADLDSSEDAAYQAIVRRVRLALDRRGCAGVPLIGCSAAACLWDDAVHDQGAMLLCLASQYIGVRTSRGLDARNRPDAAASDLLTQLDYRPRGSTRHNQFLLLFIPGYATPADGVFDPLTYRAEEFFEAVREATNEGPALFGGVSSREDVGRPAGETAAADPRSKDAGSLAGGYQFLNDQVLADDAVAALVTLEYTFALQLAETFEETGERLSLQSCADERIIDDPATVDRLLALDPECLLCDDRGDQSRVLIPHSDGRTFKLPRGLRGSRDLAVIRPKADKLISSLWDLVQRRVTQLDVPRRQLVGLLAIVGRTRWKDLPGYLGTYGSAFSAAIGKVPRIGCILDGEIGPDSLGKPTFNHCCASRLLLSEAVNTQQHRVFDAFAKLEIKVSLSPAGALTQAVQVLQGTGYPGGMISLIEESEGRDFVVARAATEGPWRKQVLPVTIRPKDGNDILAVVTRESPFYYVDNVDRHECVEKGIANLAGITSFVAIPLVRRPDVVGVVQIDMGDMRDVPDLHPKHKDFLEELADLLSLWVVHSLEMAELAVSKKLDGILAECTKQPGFYQAVRRFFDGLGSMVRSIAEDMPGEAARVSSHIRVPRGDPLRLWLADGIGEFFDEARRTRVDIAVDDPTSSSARAFRTRSRIIVNDVERSGDFRRHREALEKAKIAGPLKRIKSCFVIPLAARGEEPLGILDISATVPWFFSRYLLRALDDVASRLPAVLDSVRKADDLSFLLEAHIDQLLREGADANRREALNSALRQVCRGANAQIASCYLNDPARGCCVLRGTFGWHSGDKLNGIAWYGPNDGVIGKCLYQSPSKPVYGCIGGTESTDASDQKHIAEMFGAAPPLYEFLVLPIRFGEQPLGGVVLHRAFSAEEPDFRSGFRSIDESLLSKVAAHLSNAIAATDNYTKLEWQKHEAELLTQVNAGLSGALQGNQGEMLQRLCEIVRDRYELRRCCIYLAAAPANATERKLRLAGESWASALERSSLPSIGPVLGNASGRTVRARSELAWRAYLEKAIQVARRPAAKPKWSTTPWSLARSWLDRSPRETAVPLLLDDNCLGVLVLTWGKLHVPAINVPDGNRAVGRQRASVIQRYSLEHLQQLSQLISGVIYRADAEKKRVETARTIAALRAHAGMAIFLTANLHALANGVQQFQAGLRTVGQPTTGARTRRKILQTLEDTSADLVNRLDRAAGIGRLLLNQGTYATFSPWEVARQTAAERAAQHREVKVSFSPLRPPGATPVAEVQASGDRRLIGECLDNLIHNAIRASGPGGRVKVRCILKVEEGQFHVDVQDNGPGISQEDFQHFMSGRPVVDIVQGSGMGLLLGRVFAELHGGALGLVKSSRRGSTVRLTIPVKVEE